MLDKNGKEIHVGDVVEITGAYNKSDNGLYFVENGHENPAWHGNDIVLKRICKNGKISKSGKTENYWPLWSLSNALSKRSNINNYNNSNSKIEVRKDIDKSYIVNYFCDKIDENIALANYMKRKDLHDMSTYYKSIASFYKNVCGEIV